jgi:hypothetical protein
MSQFTLSAAAGGGVVADADGVGVVQALGLVEGVAVVDGGTVGAAVEVGVAEAVGMAVDVGVGVVVLGGTGWRRQRSTGGWAAVTAAPVVAETLAETLGAAESVGATESVGIAEAESVAGVVVPGVADDETQAAPLAASLVVASFDPECDEKSIPATTPSTATSIPAIAPRRARGRSSNTW